MTANDPRPSGIDPEAFSFPHFEHLFLSQLQTLGLLPKES